MPRTRFFVVLLVLAALALSSGCAHKKAISQANQYAQQDQWRKAYAQCQRALELNPDSDEAQKCAADTRPRATSAALEDARAELNAQRYAAALDHIDYVDSIHDEPPAEATELRATIQDAVRSRLTNYIENDQMRKAYDFAGTARDLYPSASFVENAYSECRSYFEARARVAEADKDYAGAVDALGVISTYEPGRSDAIQREQRRIKDLWAQMLEDEARQLESDGKRAGATVKYARAFELSSREKARVQLRRLVDELRADTLFGVSWALEGPDDWSRSVETSLTPYLDENPGLIRDEDSPELEMTFDLKSSDCADEATGTSRQSTEYVAGTRRVSNPDYETLRRDLTDVRDDLRDARDTHSDLEVAYEEADRSVETYRSDVYSPLVADLDDARREERDLEAQVESAEDLVEQGEAQIRRLESDENVSDDTIAAQRMTVQTLRKDLYNKENRLENARRERQRLEREFRDAKSELGDRERERDRLYEDVADAKREVTDLSDRESRLETELRSTPQTVEEEIVKTFDYEVTDWKRTCRAEVTLDVRVTDTDKSYTTTLEASASTTDSAHQGYAQYGVEADRLAFPTDDVTLWDQVDDKLAERANQIIAGHARKYWNRRIAEAVAAMDDDPHLASDVLMSVYLSSPGSLDSGEVKALEEHLTEHYGASPLSTVANR